METCWPGLCASSALPRSSMLVIEVPPTEVMTEYRVMPAPAAGAPDTTPATIAPGETVRLSCAAAFASRFCTETPMYPVWPQRSCELACPDRVWLITLRLVAGGV